MPNVRVSSRAPAALGADQLDVFARCVGSLPLRATTRDYDIGQSAMLEYEPGFEVQIRYETNGNVAWLTAIGFTSHADTSNTRPMITARALDAARVADSAAALTTTERGALANSLRTSELDYESVWIEVCVDAAGSVTSTNAVAATSIGARDVSRRTPHAGAFAHLCCVGGRLRSAAW